MRVASAHFAGQGWSITDVSSNSSYDLLCRRGNEERRVEVKGTTGGAATVFLTRNEVVAAQSAPSVAVLAIVHHIPLESETVASGGELKLFEPWSLRSEDLIPLMYRYTPLGRDSISGKSSGPPRPDALG
jgi:hypothetical protein